MSHNTQKDASSTNEPLAIVGLGLRYPGDATSAKDFWEMLMERRCASTKFPSDRLNVDAHHHPDSSRFDSLGADGGHFISGDLGAFDAPFFSINSAEADEMDPQQRVVLETAYQALENAGISMEKAAGSQTCVFTGCSANDYATFYSKDPHSAGKYAAYGQSMNMVANRVSWFYNLRGPSVNVDTACSSSLVALDMACQSIWSGVSTAGLVVGVNLIFAREFSNSLDNLGVLSPNNRCFTFDERANGYGRGEGVGAVVIKPVQDALRDGDNIRAVIRASQSNQDGWTPGITMPNREAQEALIASCYRQANLDPAVTRYVETHGTGTPTGDPIETRAIGKLFRPHRTPEDPLYVGSVKTNIGHLESGSGVAGLIKVVLSLEEGVIPPVSENLQKVSPALDLDFSNLKIVTEATPWPPGLRRASINSFGFGGTNSHVVLDDAAHFLEQEGLTPNSNLLTPPSSNSSVSGDHPNHENLATGNYLAHSLTDSDEVPSHLRILTWSSADEGGIQRLAEPWTHYFNNPSSVAESDEYLACLSHTLNQRRSRLPWMTYALVDEKTKLSSVVEAWNSPIRGEESHTVAYVFSGQGAQWPAMGRELLSRYSVYHDSLVKAGTYLRSLGCDWDLLTELQKDAAESSVNDPMLAQPLCTAIQVALVDLLSTFGLKASAVVGHSSGEIAAAYCAGAISREYAWRLAYFRGLWAAKVSTSSSMDGAMMAVALSSEQIEPFFDRIKDNGQPLSVSVACINGPKAISVSGARRQIDQIHSWLKEDEVFARVLPIPVAYHSLQMEEIAEAYKNSVGDDQGASSRDLGDSPQMVSSVTGEWVDYDQLSKAEYWVTNLLSTVQFLNAFRKLAKDSSSLSTKKLDGSHRKYLSVDMLVEIGPHAAMRGPCRDILGEVGRKDQVQYLSLLTRNTSGVRTALEALARLHCLGYPVDLSVVNSMSSRVPKEQPRVLTDLPPYQFNHTKSYWREGPNSKGFRLRRFGRHEMLGWPDDDWNPLLPNWNNNLQPSDPIWIRDHQISNTIVLPGASMLSMAIEAVKQLTDSNFEITGFNFKNVKFMSALTLPANSPGIRTRLSMRPDRDDGPENGGWYEYSLFSNKGQWNKHSTGYIQAVINKDRNTEVLVERNDSLRQFHEMKGRSTTVLDRGIFYKNLHRSILQFGPSFECITSMASDRASSLVTEIQTYSLEGSDNWSERYTIHPTTLDGLMQGTQVLRSEGGQKAISPAIPTGIDRAWFSNTGLASPKAPSIKVGTNLVHEGRQESRFNLTAVDREAQNVLIAIDGVIFTTIDSQNNAQDVDGGREESTCHQIDWKPDLGLLSKTETLQLFQKAIPESSPQGLRYMNMDLMITGFIARAMHIIDQKEDLSHLSPGVQSYIGWLKSQLQIIVDGKSPFSSTYWQEQIRDETAFNELCDSVYSDDRQGKHLVAVGRDLLSFAQEGFSQPLSQVLNEELLRESYKEMWENTAGIQRWKSYIDTLGHKRPDMKILEIDGGIASVSDLIVDTLTVHRPDGRTVPRFRQFEICNNNEEQLSVLQQRIGDCGPRVSFNVWDIEGDAGSFLSGSLKYDLIVVCLGFHGVKSIEASLKVIRSMLNDNGELIVIDMANPDSVRSTFVHGLGERWWINTEPYRKDGHSIDESTWDETLRQSGFSGSELVFRDHDHKSSHELSVIVSHVNQQVTNEASSQKPPISLLWQPDGPNQRGVCEQLETQLEPLASSVDYWTIDHDIPKPLSSDHICIVLLELDNAILADMSATVFQMLQNLTLNYHRIIWVTSHAGSTSSPSLGVVDGLFRVLNSEDSRGVFTTLSLDSTDFKIDLVTRVVRSLVSGTSHETEYKERSGVLHIPRIVEAPHLSGPVTRLQASKSRVRQQWNSGPALKLHVGQGGMLDDLHFIEDNSRASELPSDKIEIKVKAVGANFRDILVLLGRMDQTTVGFECAGVVTRVGEDCTGFQIGDHVAGCDFDTYSSYARLHSAAAVKLPTGMSFAEAAAIPTNFVTAWHAFSAIANVQPGETVLIHSGAGGTGQAAIQIAQHLGASVIATVGNPQKRAFLMEKYGIPESHIFSSRDTQFAAGVRRLTKGSGVDVVLNSLSGDGLVASWECIAPYGRFVEMGKRDILGHSGLDMYHFARNVSFTAIDLAMVTHERPHLIGKALRAVMPLISEGILHVSSPHKVHGIGELETGLRALQGGQSSGKVVFEMREHDIVDALIPPQNTQSFDPNATYILAGGLGGLGRNIARWMISRGAKNLLLLSRSGAQSQDALSFISELSTHDVKVLAPSCDIADRSMLEAVLGDVSSCMPPIKGCIQATMVLQDSMFEQMEYSQWSRAAAPKISGTWNLHQLLPSGLDHFIMISSISSVMGNRGQANYAAANSFMDSLAHYRTANGERGTSLNMGFFLSAGAVAQSSSLKSHFKSNLPFVPVTEAELHALLSIYCDVSAAQPNQENCQTVLGLKTSQEVYKRNPDAAYWLQKPAFKQILSTDHSGESEGDSSQRDGASGAGKNLSSADSLEAVDAVVMDLLVAKLSKALSVNKEEFVGKKPMHSYGIDSLVAVELRNWFSKELTVDIAIFDMLGGATISAVVRLAAEKIFAKRTG